MSTDLHLIPKVEDVLDEFIKSEEEERLPDGCFHPSSLWMCDRQAVMSARGEPHTTPHSDTTKRVFHIGHLMHGVIQEALVHKYGTDFEDEFKVQGRLLAGHGDGLLLLGSAEDPLTEDDCIVYEFKSTKSLSRLKKELQPQEHHLKQVATYAVTLKRQGYNVLAVRIAYFEKTSLEIVEFQVKYNPAWEKMVDDKINSLAPYLEDESFKDKYPPCSGPKWLHSYCPFYPACERATKDGKFMGSNLAASLPDPNLKEFQW